MNAIEKKVSDVFVEILRLDNDFDRNTLKYNETQGWDSIGHMSIIAALEEKFNCMMETDEILDMSSFHKAIEIMEKYT